jgi:hypothetical protein
MKTDQDHRLRTFSTQLILFVILFIALTGCQPAVLPPQPQAEPTNTAEPPSAKQWSVNLTVTGGFAGIHKVMELSSDGSYQVTDMRTGENKKSSLSESELNKISTLIDQIQGGQDPYPSVCADCFIYELTVQKGKETYRLTLDDINLSDSEAAPLIEELMALGRLSTP